MDEDHVFTKRFIECVKKTGEERSEQVHEEAVEWVLMAAALTILPLLGLVYSVSHNGPHP